MGWIAAITGAVGAANDVYDNNKATAAAQVEAADNKQLALEAAADATTRGNQDAGKARMYGSQLIARQKVAFASSGVDPTVGTPADVMADTRMTSELDAQTLENNAAREAWGFRKHGLKYGQQAQLDAARSSSRNAGTLLTGVGRVGSAFASEYDRGGWGK